MFERTIRIITTKRVIIILSLVIILAAAITIGFCEYDSVYHMGTVEAGMPFCAKDFLKDENDSREVPEKKETSKE